MDTDYIPDPPYVGGDHAAQCRGCDGCRLEEAEWLLHKAEAENQRLRAAITSAYYELRQVKYGGSGGDVFEQVAPIETALGRIVDDR